MGITARCGGCSATFIGGRPRWEAVFSAYSAENNNDHMFLQKYFGVNYLNDNRYARIEPGAARVSIALIKSGMMNKFNAVENGIEIPGGINITFDIRHSTGVAGDRRQVKIIATAEELKTWLSQEVRDGCAGWGRADQRHYNPSDMNVLHERIAQTATVLPRNGLYIISGPQRNHATLWLCSKKDVICGINYITAFPQNSGSRRPPNDSNYTVYFWELKGSSRQYCEYGNDVDFRVFSQEEFNTFKRFIDENSSRNDGRLDCIRTVHRGLELLLSATIPIKEYGERDKRNTLFTMGNLMKEVVRLEHARESIDIDFKDHRTGRPPVGLTNPTGYLGNSLSETVRATIGSTKRNGYYIFALSIAHALHTAILIAKIEGTDVTFNVFDQHGSLVNREMNRFPGRGRALDHWHNDQDLDEALLKYVSRIRIRGYDEYRVPNSFAQTITTIYPINKK